MFTLLLPSVSEMSAYADPSLRPARSTSSSKNRAPKAKRDAPQRVWSALPSVEPGDDRSKLFIQSLQSGIAIEITRDAMQQPTKAGKKLKLVGRKAAFSASGELAGKVAAATGKVITPLGELYAVFLPTVDGGVAAVIEAATHLPTNSRADLKRSAEVESRGFVLRKVVDRYQVAYWPELSPLGLGATVTKAPALLSGALLPSDAAKLIRTKGMGAKGAAADDPLASNFSTLEMLKCGFGLSPQPPTGGLDPVASGESPQSGSSPQSGASPHDQFPGGHPREVLDSCTGGVYCAGFRPPAAPGLPVPSGTGCWCDSYNPGGPDSHDDPTECKGPIVCAAEKTQPGRLAGCWCQETTESNTTGDELTDDTGESACKGGHLVCIKSPEADTDSGRAGCFCLGAPPLGNDPPPQSPEPPAAGGCAPEDTVCVKPINPNEYTGPSCYCRDQGTGQSGQPETSLPQGEVSPVPSEPPAAPASPGPEVADPRVPVTVAPDGDKNPDSAGETPPGHCELPAPALDGPVQLPVVEESAVEQRPARASCGDGICQRIVCMAIGCPLPEDEASCPQDCGPA